MLAGLYDWLVLPATVLHSVLAAWTPPVAEFFDSALDHGDWRIPVALSLAIWLLVGFSVWRLVSMVVHEMLALWLSVASHVFRHRLVWRMRYERWQAAWAERFPGGGADADAPEVRLDADALAIMQFAAGLHPGQTLAAPELAEAFGETPRTIQKRLEQLLALQLLERASSQTDGFADYRLSRPGSMYLELWQTQPS